MKLVVFVLLLLLCSCGTPLSNPRNANDDPPASNYESREKSAADTSFTEHWDEIKQLEQKSLKSEPSGDSEHFTTQPPSGNNDQQNERAISGKQSSTK